MDIVVIGATGKTGQPLAKELAARGVRVRAANRKPPNDSGVEPVLFDWANRETWAAVVDRADAMYIVGPAFETNAADLFAEFLEAAKEVPKVVLLSLIDAERLPPSVPLAAWEQAVVQSGKDWTILRPNWFQQNFGHGFFTSELRETGRLELPAGNQPISFVDTRDVADSAATILTGNGHTEKTYVLTGPDSLTHDEVLAELGSASGRNLKYSALKKWDYANRLREAGFPEAAIQWQIGLYDLIQDGANTPVTDAVERLTGRAARPLRAYAAEFAHVGRP
jgi:uncharacterized protein YbjT (DUF2867 family)